MYNLPSISQAEIDKHTPSLSSHVAVIHDEVDWNRFLDSSSEKVRAIKFLDLGRFFDFPVFHFLSQSSSSVGFA
jgi:hypothetical protein